MIGSRMLGRRTARGGPVDLLIRCARIVDGTGGPWYRGEIAIDRDRIIAIASFLEVDAAEVLESSGSNRILGLGGLSRAISATTCAILASFGSRRWFVR